MESFHTDSLPWFLPPVSLITDPCTNVLLGMLNVIKLRLKLDLSNHFVIFLFVLMAFSLYRRYFLEHTRDGFHLNLIVVVIYQT